MLGQEALRERLSQLPEINLSHETEGVLLARHGLPAVPNQVPANRRPAGQAGFLGPVLNRPAAQAHHNNRQGMHVAQRHDNSLPTVALFREMQPELGHLPWRMGEQCHLDREAAEELEIQSRSLRNLLQLATNPEDTRPDAEILRTELLSPDRVPGLALARVAALARGGNPFAGIPVVGVAEGKWDRPSAVPALMQLLMAERTPTRQVLVEVLGRIKGPAASKALARLAIFDLAPEVRERALVTLRGRPPGDYRPTLIEGFRYPWAPVADHAAEALVALEDREAIPTLVGLLDEPDPVHPRTEDRNGRPVTYNRMLVQVNHLRNCLLCHAPSTSATTDLVRGRVPTEGMPLPPPQEYYASRSPGEFVRAEVTYLRQDFSVMQPVEQSAPWPGFQRYDYLVYEQPVAGRPLPNPRHREKGKAKRHDPPAPSSSQRESALFALRELTGKDLGNESAAWKAEIEARAPDR
jgi:hypothetical protein